MPSTSRDPRYQDRDGPADAPAATADTGDRPTVAETRTGDTADRPTVTETRTADPIDDRAGASETRTLRTDDRTAAPAAITDVVEQRRRFGGFKIGAAFFGWLVATGLAAILTGIGVAAGLAFAINSSTSASDTIDYAGLAVLVAIVAVAYYCGGYVAGRLARFDGARQGLGVWLLGVITTVGFAVAGAVWGNDYNVPGRYDLPTLPVGDVTTTTKGGVAIAAAAVATLLFALLGGKVGERYHRKIDRAGAAGLPATAAPFSGRGRAHGDAD